MIPPGITAQDKNHMPQPIPQVALSHADKLKVGFGPPMSQVKTLP